MLPSLSFTKESPQSSGNQAPPATPFTWDSGTAQRFLVIVFVCQLSYRKEIFSPTPPELASSYPVILCPCLSKYISRLFKSSSSVCFPNHFAAHRESHTPIRWVKRGPESREHLTLQYCGHDGTSQLKRGLGSLGFYSRRRRGNRSARCRIEYSSGSLL